MRSLYLRAFAVRILDSAIRHKFGELIEQAGAGGREVFSEPAASFTILALRIKGTELFGHFVGFLVDLVDPLAALLEVGKIAAFIVQPDTETAFAKV